MLPLELRRVDERLALKRFDNLVVEFGLQAERLLENPSGLRRERVRTRRNHVAFLWSRWHVSLIAALRVRRNNETQPTLTKSVASFEFSSADSCALSDLSTSSSSRSNA